MMKLNKDAEKLIELFMHNGFEAYAVGGCVRDAVLHRPMGDIDLTTSATPQEMEALLQANGIRFAETGIRHGTVTAIVNSVPYEITTFRADGAYDDNRHPNEVTFVNDVRLDLARRDFTMNALAYNNRDGLVDAFGGMEDIQRRLIRAVGDPDRRFQEDGLRIMRALRFAAVLGFQMEEKTKQAVFRNKHLLQNIAAERLFVELKKLLLGDNAEAVLREYREVIAVVIPELLPCFDFPQNSKWHVYDVYEHTIRSVGVAPQKDYLRFALLLHDIGKPFCRTVDAHGQDHFKGHQIKSAELARQVLKRLRASNDFVLKTVSLIEVHDCYITPSPGNIKRWLRRFGESLTFDYIDLKIADIKTHNMTLAQREMEVLERIKKQTAEILERGEPYRISDLCINGNDLKQIGFEGAEIQQELETLICVVSDNPAFNDREKLITQANQDYSLLSE